MNLTISEKYGEKPITIWLAVKVKDYVMTQHGINIQINMNETTEIKAKTGSLNSEAIIKLSI